MEALLQLMHTKDYNDIRITDITARAGVSRMAYYRNYRSKDHILMDYMCSIIKEYAAELEGPEFFTNFQTYEHILRSLKYLEKYKDYVLCLKKANRAEIVLYGLDLYMLHVTEPLEKSNLAKYELYYYSGALYNIFMHWIEDDMQEDITVIASIIYDKTVTKRGFLFMKTSVSHNTAREFTKSCTMEALLQLMHTKDYNDISITDITARAGFSRMAYYRNYRSKDHILMDYMCSIIKEYAAELEG